MSRYDFDPSAGIICPSCGVAARRTETRYGGRHDCDGCGLWSWGGAPLADRETHEARKAAHAAFDPLWKVHGMTRGEAYRALRAELGLTADQCHMKDMNAGQAKIVPPAVGRILARGGKDWQ